MLVSGLLIFAASELGFRLGRGRGSLPDGHEPSWMLQTAAFTLLALLLAFSFSMALGRYDARRATVVREANDISTAFLRADVLDASTASFVRGNLMAYVAARIDYAQADADPQRRARADAFSSKAQAELWNLATHAARSDPHSTMVPLFVAALNEVINVSTEERAVLSAHIPDVVIVWLLLIALIASVMMGYGFGREGNRAPIFKAVFAVMVALVFGLVLDLDRPQRGIVRVNLTPLHSVEQMMHGGAPPAVSE
jgi:hypothetical protein